MIQPYKPIYTVRETAELLMVTKDFVYEEIKRGKLIALKLGRWKIRGTDLEQYIENLPVIEKDEVI